MKISIAHLYYDLMNLNGENGNVLALKKHLELQGIEVEIHFVTIDDKINFDKYDVIYLGSGSQENQFIVLKDILKYKKQLLNLINNNKLIILTGNSIELFGQYIESLDGTKHDGLKIFDYYAKDIDFQISGEQICNCNFIDNYIIGFINRYSVLKNSNNHLFKIIKGTGNEPKYPYEGFRHKNVYGTYLLGPILIRNPYFTDYLVKTIMQERNWKYKENINTIDYQAYDEYLKNFVNN